MKLNYNLSDKALKLFLVTGLADDFETDYADEVIAYTEEEAVEKFKEMFKEVRWMQNCDYLGLVK